MPTVIAYLKLFRLPLVFTAIADSAAGYMVRLFSWPSPWVFLCLAVASAGLYAFGMGMNDVADRERDKTLAPGRPLPSGRVSLTGALGTCMAVVTVSAVAIVLARYAWQATLGEKFEALVDEHDPKTHAWLCWGGALAAILVYDFAAKVPPFMGTVRALNFLMGYYLAESSMRSMMAGYFPGPEMAAAPFIYGTSLTYISTLEDGPVKPGRVWIGAAGMIAGLAVPCLLPLTERSYVFDGITPALGPAGVLLLWILWRATRAVDKKGVMLMVRDGVAGFILLDASIVMSTGKVVEGTVLAALLIPAFGLMQIFKRLP